MNVARILYPVEVLGPGKRVGIWVRGCIHHCKGCSNPELWNTVPEAEMTGQQLINLILSSLDGRPVDGFILTGGDPFFAPEELLELLPLLRDISDDILVYTGYTYDELVQQSTPEIMNCLSMISVLIDGKYIEELNDGSIIRGSSNQKIVFLDAEKRAKYESYFAQIGNNRIQNFALSDGIVSVGIHSPNFKDELTKKAKERGVLLDNK